MIPKDVAWFYSVELSISVQTFKETCGIKFIMCKLHALYVTCKLIES